MAIPIAALARSPVKGYRMARRAVLIRAQNTAPGAAFLDRSNFRRRTFEQVYRKGSWTKRQNESRSGLGSTLEATEQLRQALPDTLSRLQVQTFLDVPCGDGNWMSQLDLPVERYIGGDIAPSVVEAARVRFGDERHHFSVIDLCTATLPDADMLLCRDALIHFSLADISRALDNIRRANITYLATTTFPDTAANEDIVTGVRWRRLNLEAEPFNCPPPLISLTDNVFHRPDKVLAVWRTDDLRAH